MEVTAALRAQIAALEAELRNDPRLAALAHMRAALSLLGNNGSTGNSVHTAPQIFDLNISDNLKRIIPEAGGLFRPVKAIKRTNRIKQVHHVVASYLDECGPTHRKALIKLLADKGLMDGIKSPETSFSTSMYTLREHFESNGRGMFSHRRGAPKAFAPVLSVVAPLNKFE
jgi:hypothetical protein